MFKFRKKFRENIELAGKIKNDIIQTLKNRGVDISEITVQLDNGKVNVNLNVREEEQFKYN